MLDKKGMRVEEYKGRQWSNASQAASRMQATKECINTKIHSNGACQGDIAMIHDKSTEQG